MTEFAKYPGRSRIVLAVCLGALSAAPAAVAQESVTAVRYWSLGDVTRVAVEATGAFGFRSDRLSNPDRVYFDLPGTVPALERRGMNTIPVGDQFVRQIRVAETQKGTTRIVLDLVTAVEISTSVLSNPDRLMVELRRAGTAPPAQVPQMQVPEVVVTPVPTFHPPSSPVTHNYERSASRAPLLDPPPTAPSGMMPSTAFKNDALSRMPLPRVPGPPISVASRTTRPAPALVVASETTTEPRRDPVMPLRTPSVVQERIGLPAKRPGAREESMTRALGLKVGRIVIDAGHGGHDVGTTGPGGLQEKDLVLDVAKRVGALVEQHLGYEVIYTRTDDTFIPLEQRTEIANNKHADLFLSIHANSSPLSTVAGIETYYLNFTTSKLALDVAARENATSEKTVYELQDLLQKIALRDKVDESREFAGRIQTSLYAMSVKNAPRSRDRGIRKAPFVVLIGASMPSVLAEIGFISNPHDESMMRRPEYRQKIAEAMFKGISSYASTLSHFQVAQSREIQ